MGGGGEKQTTQLIFASYLGDLNSCLEKREARAACNGAAVWHEEARGAQGTLPSGAVSSCCPLLQEVWATAVGSGSREAEEPLHPDAEWHSPA